MKKLSVVLYVLVFLAACKKNTTTIHPEPVKPVNQLVSQFVKDGEVWTISYHADSTINSIDRKFTDNAPIDTYRFIYQNGKLTEVKSAGRWKYVYTGEELTSIETYNNFGMLRYRTVLAYTNGKLTEKTGYLTTTATTDKPNLKTKYTYGADGNVSKKEFFEYVNNGWFKSDEVHIIKYDTYPNNADHLESFPFIPKKFYSVNNPLQENYVNNQGAVYGSVIHDYQYDTNKRAILRKSTYSYNGFPDTHSEAKFQY